MALSQRISELTQAFAKELKARPTADHAGLARAWVCMADCGFPAAPAVLASHNIASVERLGRGSYRIHFASPMVDAHFCWQGHAWHVSWWFGFKPRAARLQCVIKTPYWIELSCRNAIGFPVAACELNLTIWR